MRTLIVCAALIAGCGPPLPATTSVTSDVPGVKFRQPNAIFGPDEKTLGLIIVTDVPNPCDHLVSNRRGLFGYERSAIVVDDVVQQALVIEQLSRAELDHGTNGKTLTADDFTLSTAWAKDGSLRGIFDAKFGASSVSGTFVAWECTRAREGGCSATGGGAAALVAVALLLRKRKRPPPEGAAVRAGNRRAVRTRAVTSGSARRPCWPRPSCGCLPSSSRRCRGCSRRP